MVAPVRSGDPERRQSVLLRALRPTLVARAAYALLSNPAALKPGATVCTSNFGYEATIKMPPPPVWFAGSTISSGEIGGRADARFRCDGWRCGAWLIRAGDSLRKNPVFDVRPPDVRPLKGRLIRMAFGIAKAMP